MNNYTIYHCHTDRSLVSGQDSVTSFEDYVSRSKELGMKALGISEHGNLYGWLSKKKAIESAGLLYIHVVEAYITMSLEEKTRDNYHLILIAKNYDGFLELNHLVSNSFNREDGHFYYVPRITFDELSKTSDNIIVCTACIGGFFGKGYQEDQTMMLNFMRNNKDRCFFEVQHHNVGIQKEYNLKMLQLSKETNIPLISGTDVHSLNEKHAEGRIIMQISKNVHFEGEDNWDLIFKTYDELVDAYKKQGSLEESVYLEAIDNTNKMADMIEPFSLNRENKYPKIFDNPVEVFKQKIDDSIKNHKYINDRYTPEVIKERVDNEFAAYTKTKSTDYMLLEDKVREFEEQNNIQRGYSRGSVSGSFITYALGITQMDSIKFDLNFFRFINPDRVSLADIDVDYGEEDRDKVKYFLLHDKMNIPKLHSSEIITFNKLKLKSAIKDVGRALDMPLPLVQEISDAVRKAKDDDFEEDEEKIEYIIDQKWRDKYPKLFYYVDIVNGTIVSVGSHPSGVLISDLDIESGIGMCSITKSDYPVSMLDMKELDYLNYVKLDILGLDNISVINKTCQMVGIERLTPDNVNLNDERVWKSLRDDSTGIFQWESASARNYLSQFMSDETVAKAKQIIPNFSMIKWLSFGNGLIRPGCASYRDSASQCEIYDNGMPEINEFLAPTLGHVAFQEDLMRFLVTFCGYSQSDSDTVRRLVSKSKSTDAILPEIESRFIKFVNEKYGTPEDHAKNVIQSFLKIVQDASSYMFSWNHSDSYSIIGYICGYLRYYYPLEFLTVSLNVFGDKKDAKSGTPKSEPIITYAQKIGIKLLRPKFRFSKSDYFMDKDSKSIYKGISSIKGVSANTANDLEKLYEKEYSCFTDILYDLSQNTCANITQVKHLIQIGFFEEFGNVAELIKVYDNFAFFSYGTSKIIKKDKLTDDIISEIVHRNSTETEKQYRLISIKDILLEIDSYIMSLKIKEYSLKSRIKFQKELLGYVDLSSGKKEDLRKLVIIDIEPKLTKDKKKTWAYSVTSSSLGSGKKSELMIMSRAFEANPINTYDVIEVRDECLQKKVTGKYTNWYLSGYTVLKNNI